VAAAAVDGRIHLVGGYRADGATVATVELFDTATGAWRPGPDLPLAVNHAMAATVAGAVHVFGGYTADGAPSRQAFRLDGGSWRRLADAPQGRAAGAAAAVGDRVYLAGGVGPDRRLATGTLVYDPAADRWGEAPGLPTPREHLGGAAAGGLLYTVGGRTGRGNLATVEAYDPRRGTWTTLPDLPTARGGLAAAASCSGQVVAVGGEELTGPAAATFPQVEIYDPPTRGWRTLPALPTPRHGLGVVVVADTLYVLMGGPRPGLHVSTAAEALPLGPC
jgi:non-specific serine/threonine protein kinase